MDKKKLLETCIHELQEKLDLLIRSAKEAHQAAIHTESIAEDKYDTRGLEASYLAGAQSKRAQDLRRDIRDLKYLYLKPFDKSTPLDLSALVLLQGEDNEKSYYFILPNSGGLKLNFNQSPLTIVTPDSPIGKALIGTRLGDSIEVKIQNTNRHFEILNCW